MVHSNRQNHKKGILVSIRIPARRCDKAKLTEKNKRKKHQQIKRKTEEICFVFSASTERCV